MIEVIWDWGTADRKDWSEEEKEIDGVKAAIEQISHLISSEKSEKDVPFWWYADLPRNESFNQKKLFKSFILLLAGY